MQSILQRFPYAGASISLYMISKNKSLSRLDRAATRYGAEMAYRLESGKQNSSLSDIYSKISELRDAVATEDASLIDASIALSVVGGSIGEMESRLKSLESELRANGIGIFNGRYAQHKLSAMFDACATPRFPTVVSITEHSLPALVPFTQTPLFHAGGTKVGVDAADGSPVIFDRFAGSNFNTVIIGKSGSGKSYFAKLMILRETETRPSHCFILDPLGEFMHIALSLGGCHRSVESEGLGAGRFIVSHSAGIVSDAVDLVCKAVQLGEREISKVKDLFYSCAASNPGETIAGVFSKVSISLNQIGAADVSRRIGRAISGDLSFILSGKSFDIGKGRITVLDYSRIDAGLKSSIALFLLESAFEICKHTGGVKTIIIDEAWRFNDDDQLRASLSKAMRHSRHYNLAIMLLTQNISDVTGSTFNSGILNNTDSCFIFRHEEGISALPEDYHLAAEERDFINAFTPRDARKSRCIMIGAGRKVKLEIESEMEEFALCNSEAAESSSLFQLLCALAIETLDRIDRLTGEA